MKLAPEKIRKIAVLRALQLGDMLCAVPALKTLRNAYPEAQISLIGLPWAEAFVSRFHAYLDRFIEFPGYPGLPEQAVDPIKVVNFLQQMQKEQFDLLVQMQGDGSYVNSMLTLLDAINLAGFYQKGDYCPGEDLFMVYPDEGSEIRRHLLLMKHLGLESEKPDLEFPVTVADVRDFDALGLPPTEKNYVCVHAGSRGSWRQWPPEHFATLADYCYEQGFQIVLTGTADEWELAERVKNHMKHPSVNLAGKSSLGGMAILLKQSAMLISNCTGVSHMAAAFRTPSIVISMDGEPDRWAPLNQSIHKTTNWLVQPDLKKVLNDTMSLIQTSSKMPLRR